MNSYLIIFVISLVTSSSTAVPIATPDAGPIPTDEGTGRISTNDLFSQLNEIIKRQIGGKIQNTSLDVGDVIKGDEGQLEISIQQFSSDDSFPVHFHPKDKEVLEDKEVIPIVNDFDGSSEYKLEKNSSEESSEESSEKLLHVKPVEVPKKSSENIRTSPTTAATSSNSSTSTASSSTTAASSSSKSSETSTKGTPSISPETTNASPTTLTTSSPTTQSPTTAKSS